MSNRVKKKSFFWRMISSKIVIIFLFIFLILLAVATSKTAKKRYKIEREVYNLKREIAELEKQKNEFSQLIEYLNTLSFKENEARLKLGLQKEGEKTVIITSPYSELKSEETAEDKKTLPISNISKWWKYFWGRNNNS